MGKVLVKQNITFCQTNIFVGPLWVGLTHETIAENPAWHNSSSSSHVLYMSLFSRVASRETVASQLWNLLDQLLELDSSSIFHTHPLQLNPHTYRENDWRNYNQIWHGIKANTKSLEITMFPHSVASLSLGIWDTPTLGPGMCTLLWMMVCSL